MLEPIVAGLAGSLLIAGAAYYKKSLSLSGAAAAVVMGTAMFALGSVAWYGTLIVFFLTSSALSHWKKKRKAAAESVYAKSGRRDAGQVLANGGVGAALCLCAAIVPHPLWFAAFTGAMAAVTADTWATEVGGLSRALPRSIVSGRRVAAGTSGGVTLLGLSASAAGGLTIGLSAWALLHMTSGHLRWSDQMAAEWPDAVLPVIGLAGGLLGSLGDSWLGAVCQAMYRCPGCGREVEKRIHCGRRTEPVRGLRWMTNDAVNAICSVLGALSAAALAMLWI